VVAAAPRDDAGRDLERTLREAPHRLGGTLDSSARRGPCAAGAAFVGPPAGADGSFSRRPDRTPDDSGRHRHVHRDIARTLAHALGRGRRLPGTPSDQAGRHPGRCERRCPTQGPRGRGTSPCARSDARHGHAAPAKACPRREGGTTLPCQAASAASAASAREAFSSVQRCRRERRSHAGVSRGRRRRARRPGRAHSPGRADPPC
jgi:hypothetical protein